MIPKIIHQTWGDDNIPQKYLDLQRRMMVLNPGWELRVTNDKSNRAYIENNHPGFLNTYDAYPKEIQRADVIRYFLLHDIGGVYVDLDTEFEVPLEAFCEGLDAFCDIENDHMAKQRRVDHYVSNAFMGSVPGHPFFNLVINNLDASMEIRNAMDIICSTGPLLLSKLYEIVIIQPTLISGSDMGFKHLCDGNWWGKDKELDYHGY